jgi:hypothetical protein
MPSDAKQAPAATPAASSAMNEQLEALGYLGNGDEEKATSPPRLQSPTCCWSLWTPCVRIVSRPCAMAYP